jgi:hypothetical protein
MKTKILSLLLGAAMLHAVFLSAQSVQGAFSTPQINREYYVGQVPGFYPTIQSAVTATCAIASGPGSLGSRVVVSAGSPADGTSGYTVSAVTGGCTKVPIIDQRAQPATTCSWGGSSYSCSSGGGGGAGSACPLKNATNLCITESPYFASPDGLVKTATTSTTAPGTTAVSVASCATWSSTIAQGVHIPGAGASGASYIGPATCTGTTMTLTTATATSVASGTLVEHDDTAAYTAAIAALTTAGGGTIWHPDGNYSARGSLQDTSGANAVLAMPVIANYAANMVAIGFRGYTVPVPSTPSHGAILTTSLNSGNFIAGFDSAPGGGKAPFTNVWLDLEDMQFWDDTANPGATLIDATNVQNLTAKNLIIGAVGSSLPTNTAGWALKYPGSANNVRINVDNVAVGGLYNGIKLGEHSHTGSIYAGNTANCFVFDPGTNAGDGPIYNNNSISVDYLWGLGCTNFITAFSNLATLNVQVADAESTTGYGINDPSNLLHGIVNFSVPLPASHCTLAVNGASNLQLNALQCINDPKPAVTLENWKSQEGSGTTLANSGSDSTNFATTTNVTWAASTGFTGTVATYNGTSSVSIASSATQTAFDGTTPFTACAWFNLSSLTFPSGGSLATVMSNLSLATGNPGWRMGIFGTGATPVGAMDIYLSNNVSTNVIHVHSNPSGFSAGTIQLGCFTYDGTKTAAGVIPYINGAAAGTVIASDTLTGSIVSTAPLYLGGEIDNADWFPGALGRVRVYNRKLSAAEISTMFTNGPNAI